MPGNARQCLAVVVGVSSPALLCGLEALVRSIPGLAFGGAATGLNALQMLAQGSCNKTIARDLGIAVGTVKTHVCAIMCKLDARSRTEAVLRACRLGLIRFP